MAFSIAAPTTWWDWFRTTAPGFRSNHLWKKVIALPTYVLLLLTLAFAPAVGVLALFLIALAFDSWGARSLVTHYVPGAASNYFSVKAIAWSVAILCSLSVGLLLATSVTYIATPVTVGFLAWWIVWRDRSPFWIRCLLMLAATIVTPVVLLGWYWRKTGGWPRLALLAALIGAVDTYVLVALITLIDPSAFGSGKYWLVLDLGVTALASGCAFALSALARFAVVYGPPALGREGSTDGVASTPTANGEWIARHSRITRAASFLPRVAFWALIQALFLTPWLLIVPKTEDSATAFGVGIIATICVLPLVATSVIALFPEGGADTSLAAWIQRHLAVAGGSAVLLAIAVTATFGLIDSEGVVASRDPLPIMVVMGSMVGLSMSLSLRLTGRLRFRTHWTYAGTILTIPLVALMTLLLIIYRLGTPTYSPPDSWAVLGNQLLVSSEIAAVVVGSAFVGVTAGTWLLDPGLQRFAQALRRVKEMVLPLVGFMAGYGLIVVFFGAVYWAAYAMHQDYFICTHVDVKSSAPQTVPCSEDPSPYNSSAAGSTLTEADFMYLSINTALPLGYSRVRPADGARAIQWMSAAELIIATSWVVVVFAAMLHALQEGMIRKATEDELGAVRAEIKAQLGNLIAGVGPPASTAPARLGVAAPAAEPLKQRSRGRSPRVSK